MYNVVRNTFFILTLLSNSLVFQISLAQSNSIDQSQVLSQQFINIMQRSSVTTPPHLTLPGAKPTITLPETNSNKRGFWQKGAAISPFAESLASSEQQKIVIIRQPTEEKDPLNPTNMVSKNTETTESSKDKYNLSKLSKEEFREYMLNNHGKPDEIPAVHAKEEAPETFKAVMEAVNFGDYDMALKYARRHLIYQQRSNELAFQVAELQKLAASLENYLPPEPVSEDPQYNGISQAYAKALEEMNKEKQTSVGEKAKVIEMPQVASSLLKSGESNEARIVEKEREFAMNNTDGAENTDLVNQDTNSNKVLSPQLSEKQQREKVRSIYSSKITPDPNGEVRVYYFLKRFDVAGREMLTELTKLYDLYKSNKKFNLVAFTAEPLSDLDKVLFKRSLNVPFPVRDGFDIARSMNINLTPATVIVAPTTNKAIIEEGVRTFAELDEMIKLVLGEKSTAKSVDKE
jgi:hypothetical protein